MSRKQRGDRDANAAREQGHEGRTEDGGAEHVTGDHLGAALQRGTDPRVERLEARKREIRENYSRFPMMDWFRLRSDKKRDKVPNVEFERHDVLAMIIAALSLVLPWALGAAAVVAGLIWLMGRAFGG